MPVAPENLMIERGAAALETQDIVAAESVRLMIGRRGKEGGIVRGIAIIGDRRLAVSVVNDWPGTIDQIPGIG